MYNEVFSFTPDGESEIHILAGQLRLCLLENARHKVMTLVFPEQTEEEMVLRQGLEAARMASMTILEASEPVIVGLWPGGTNILIDGAHRRWFCAQRGITMIKGWVVSEEIWRQFVLTDEDMASSFHMRDGSLLPQRRK